MDSVYVRQVGNVSVADAYHRLRNYSRLLGDEIYGNEIVYYMNALVRSKPPGVADSLVDIAEASPPVSADAIAGAIELKSSKAGPWVERHADELGPTSWMIITAAVQRAEWRDSTVMRVLMEQALHGQPDSTNPKDRFKPRRNPTLVFSELGTFKEAKVFAQMADTTVSPRLRWSALGVLSRFDYPPFNRRIRAELQRLDQMPIWLREELEEHRRYDFLPELRAIQGRLASSVSEYERKWLRETIAYLEEKKEERAPLGVPLDWPEVTREDQGSEQVDEE
jgi:hypothetical protein